VDSLIAFLAGGLSAWLYFTAYYAWREHRAAKAAKRAP
jgi:hypothetical protein